MQIDTKKTVQKTLNKYKWDNPDGWKRDALGEFSRDVYKKNGLIIRQKMNENCQVVSFELPDFTMYLSSGMHRDLMTLGSAKKVPYHSLAIETTLGEKKVFHSIQDDSGYTNIRGDRQFVFNFLEKVPDNYFVLEKDEKGAYISSCYMRPVNSVMKHNKTRCRMGKDRE